MTTPFIPVLRAAPRPNAPGSATSTITRSIGSPPNSTPACPASRPGPSAHLRRYSTRFQDSIADQVRTLFEFALADRIFVPRDFVFFDAAVRGAKAHRPGLDRLRPLLERKAIDVLLVLSTNRLSRKMIRGLQFVEEEVHER